MQGAGDVSEIAHGADHVGIECDQIAGLDLALRRFLKPRIGPWSRGEHASIMPAAMIGKICVVQQTPQLQLAYTGAKNLLHLVDAMLGDRQCPPDAIRGL